MDAGELASIQMDMFDLMPDRCNILSVTNVNDGQGGYSQTWGTASYNVPCRLDSKGGKEAMGGGAVYPFGGFMMTLPNNTSITAQNRIEHNSVQYNILHLDKNKSWLTHIEAYLEVIP